jgi:hypothetical protein
LFEFIAALKTILTFSQHYVIKGGTIMERSKLVVIERDMYCPFCDTNSAVIISETVSSKSRIGCAAIGLKDGCLLTITGGCWAIISGIPLYDTKEEYTNVNYGFCPHCGNTYPINRPEEEKQTIGSKFQSAKQGAMNNFNSVKGMFSKNDQQ